MASQQPQAWDYPREDYIRPGSKTVHVPTHDISRPGYGQNYASVSTSSVPLMRTSSSGNNNNRPALESQHQTHRVSFSDSSDISGLSMSSTKASTGSTPLSSSAVPPPLSHHNVSLRPSRVAKSSSVRPNTNATSTFGRPPFGLEQQQYSPHVPLHNIPRVSERHVLSSTTKTSQQSIFSSPHGIREAPAPPVLSAGTTRPSATTTVTPPPNTTSLNLNHLGIPGYIGMDNNQPQMPGAFPTEVAIPYRRPTDLTTQLSMTSTHESTEHISSNSDSWDSEGDSGSCLSTSTDATTAASDSTIGKNEVYSSAHGAPPSSSSSSSSGTSTPTQTNNDGNESRSHLITRAPRSPTVVRRVGHKSILSSTSKIAPSVSSMKPSSTHHSTGSSLSGSGFGSTSSTSSRRNSQSGGPNIHIEVHRSTPRRETPTDARIRQKIEEALIEKMEQIKSEKTTQSKDSSSSSASASGKSTHTVRFAEPEKHKTVKHSQPAPAPAPAPVTLSPERESTLSKELVLQGKEIHKLELEVEKRDVLIKERDRLDQDRKAQEERNRVEQEKLELERKKKEELSQEQLEKERERSRQNLDIERRENEKERQKERQTFESQKKEMEKAQKTLERERVKERQQAEKDRKEIEKEKARIEKADQEHDRLQASFIEQGKILEDLKVRFDNQSKTLEETEAERAELREVKLQFEKRCADLAKSLGHVSDKERYVVEQVASLQIIKESLQRRVGPLEERVEKAKAEIDALHTERDGLMRETKTYLLRNTELEKEMKGLVETKRAFIAQVGDLEKDKFDLQDQVKNLKEQIATLESSMDARAKDFADHVSDLKDKHKTEMEELNSQRNVLKEEHDAHVATVKTEHEAKVADLEDQIVGLNEHIDGAHADHDTLRTNIKALESDLAAEKLKFDELAAERDKVVMDLEGHRSLAVTQETNIMNLRDEIASRSDALAKLNEANKTLQAEHAELLQKTTGEPRTAADKPDDEKKEEDDNNNKLLLQTQNKELTATITTLEATNAALTTQMTTAKTDFETRIAQLEADRDAATATLASERVEKAALAETASQVPVLTSEKVALEARAADLEAQLTQLPTLRADCARLAEQLTAANKLIEGLAAAQQQQAAAAAAASPVVTPLSPNFPTAPPHAPPESPKMAPQRKVRSRAPSMVRSVSSRSSASRRGGGIKDDIALVLVRNPADKGNVQVMRKCDLRTPRSRSQPPEKE